MAKLVKTRARTACHVMSLFHMASQGPVATAGIAPLQASCAGERVAKEPRATKIQLRFCSSTAGNLRLLGFMDRFLKIHPTARRSATHLAAFVAVYHEPPRHGRERSPFKHRFKQSDRVIS